MKLRVLAVAALAAAALGQSSAHAMLRPACNPNFPAACLIVDTVCMHGKLCQ